MSIKPKANSDSSNTDYRQGAMSKGGADSVTPAVPHSRGQGLLHQYNTVMSFARATIYKMGRTLKSGENSSMPESFSG